jgi:hypothetical protein
MRLTRVLTILLPLVALGGFFGVTMLLPMAERRATDPEQVAVTVTPIAVGTAQAMKLPVYPDARNIKQHTIPELSNFTEISFDLDGSLDSVTTFYSSTLTSLGWNNLEYDTNSSPRSQFAIYYQVDMYEEISHNFYLVVVPLKLKEDDVTTYTRLLLSWYPDATQIPILPGATQIEIVSNQQEDVSFGEPEYYTATFTTDMTIADIEAYYAEYLAARQYEVDRPSSILDPQGITYSYFQQFPGGGSNYITVTLQAEPYKDDQTRVTLIARGYNISLEQSESR